MQNDDRDWRFLAAGGAAATLLPLLVFGFGAPFWAGLIGAGAAYGGLSLLLSPRRPFEDVDPAKLSEGRLRVLRAALEETLPALARLEALKVRDRAVRERVAAIAASGRAVVAELEAAPEALASVQRLLTYYIPRAAELGEGYADMEARGVGAERRAAIADLLDKLQHAFAHYRDQLADQELAALDVEIKLVGEALTDDIGERSSRS